MTTLPPAPTYFHKPVSALNSHDAAVVRPERCKWLNYEGEIAIVIGRTCRNVSPERGRRLHPRASRWPTTTGCTTSATPTPGSMLRVKGADTLCPVGPGVVEGWDFRGKQIRTLVNGEVRQDGNTDEMEWDMHYLVADIARTITLQPGDLLLSGTPAISRTVYPGDVVEVEVEGLGTLRNHIVTGPTPIRDDVGAQPTETEEVLSTAQGGDWEFRGIRKPQPLGALSRTAPTKAAAWPAGRSSRSRPGSPRARRRCGTARGRLAQPDRRRCTPPAASRCWCTPVAPEGVVGRRRGGGAARAGPTASCCPVAATSPPAGRGRRTTHRSTTSTRSRTPSTSPWPGSRSPARRPPAGHLPGHPGGQRRPRRHPGAGHGRARGRDRPTTATTSTTSPSTTAPGRRRSSGESVEVSCYHHQCLAGLGDGLVVTARSEEGVIEAVEMAVVRRVVPRDPVAPGGHLGDRAQAARRARRAGGRGAVGGRARSAVSVLDADVLVPQRPGWRR